MSDQNTANNIQVGNGYGVMDRIINVNGIVDNSVTTESIVDNAITSSKIVDNTIVINDLALEAQPTIVEGEFKPFTTITPVNQIASTPKRFKVTVPVYQFKINGAVQSLAPTSSGYELDIVTPPGTTAWQNGNGTPGGGIGANGDYYLDDTNSDVYNKVAGAWVLITNIRGLPGASGVNAWLDGAGVPGGGLGANGQYYLNDTNGDVYNKVAGVWSVVANIKGATGTNGTNGTNGANGANGATGATGATGAQGIQGIQGIPGASGVNAWLDGAGVPGGGLGANGQYYLNDTNGDVYNKVAGVWSVVANIKGATGTNGTNGTNGANGANGATGATGATGAQGIQGIQGIPGVGGGGGFGSLIATTTTNLINTTSEVALISATISANTWLDGEVVSFEFGSLIADTSGSNVTFTMNVKIGGQTGVLTAGTLLFNGTSEVWALRKVSIMRNGADLYLYNYGISGAYQNGYTNPYSQYKVLLAGVDFTINQTLTLNSTYNVASANAYFKIIGAKCIKI